MESSAIAVGVPVFSRTDALAQLLGSLPEYVETVYVADNGTTADRRELYDSDWPFSVSLIDLPYDCGIGACRHAIAEAVTEPYLFVCDNDMEITRPGDLRLLRSVLETNDGLGGVSGWLVEGDTVRAGARDLEETGDTVLKSAREHAEIEHDPVPFARWEFIPQAALFRSNVFDTYTYDPDMYNTEHIDFFYGHAQAGDWEFASTPAVLVQHHRNIDPEYRDKRGKNHVDFDRTAAKWGFDNAAPAAESDWCTTRERPVAEQAFNVFRTLTPPAVWVPVRKALQRGLWA